MYYTTLINHQTVGIFINGLHNDKLRQTLIRANPIKFQQAVELAANEISIQKRCELRNRDIQSSRNSNNEHKNVEIDHLRSASFCTFCKISGHEYNYCKKRCGQINSVKYKFDRQHTSSNYKRQNTQIQCWFCGRVGHIRAKCVEYLRLNPLQPFVPKYRKSRVCLGASDTRKIGNNEFNSHLERNTKFMCFQDM